MDTTLTQLQRLAGSEINLKELRGYTREEIDWLTSVGHAYFQQGKLQQSQLLFEGLLAIDPKNTYFYQALAAIYVETNDLEKAKSKLDCALLLEPNDIGNYINRAKVFVQMNCLKDALEDLQKATTLVRQQKKTGILQEIKLMQEQIRKQRHNIQ